MASSWLMLERVRAIIAETLTGEYTTEMLAPRDQTGALAGRQLESSQQWPLGSANVAVRGPHGRFMGPLRSVTP